MSNYKSNINNVKKAIADAEIRALKKIGMDWQKDSMALCPVGVYPKKSKRKGGVLRGSISNVVNNNQKSVSVGSPVKYLPFVHEGTFRQKKQPFIYDAAMQNIDKFKSMVESELKKVK